jgi:5-carboxymethyl-2-hydroxymuconate isomerase
MYTTRLIATPRTFRVGKVVCLGRNYAEHIAELGNAVPERPVIFLKPATSIIGAGEQIVIPPYSRDCHHEVELALLIGKWGRNIPAEEAMHHIAGFGVAIDLTLRDVQNELKKKGLPWEIAKGFDTSCPWGPWITTADEVPDPQNLRIASRVNGETRQDSTTADLVFGPQALVDFIAETCTLAPGDLILTGTPQGVGQAMDPPRFLEAGDVVRCEIEGLGAIEHAVE